MPAPPAEAMQTAVRRAADTSIADAAWNFGSHVRRTSANLPVAAWSHVSAKDARRPARPALPGLPETMAQENPSVPRMPQRKILAQGCIERLIGDEQVIIHSRCPRGRAKLFDMHLHLRAIDRFCVLG